jgi:excisionase family DNA binding protein
MKPGCHRRASDRTYSSHIPQRRAAQPLAPDATERRMNKLLLTPSEAAQVLGVGRSKVYELMRSGALGSVRIDSCRRIPVDDLTSLVARLRADDFHDASRPQPAA